MKVRTGLKLEPYIASDQERIRLAEQFAYKAHSGQKRRSGQPFVTHPIAVAKYLISLSLDAESIMAALLHDTVEDTTVTLDQIEDSFGKNVKELVDGVTKLGQVNYQLSDPSASGRHAASVENISKLLLSMSRDLRVIMVKLADRRHNLQTLSYLPIGDRERIARESLDVFVPLADRLGMGRLKADIEDLAFRYANPVAYNLTKKLVTAGETESKQYLFRLRAAVSRSLQAGGISIVSIDGRRKHLASIYRKLDKVDGDITKIYDLNALRIIVPEISDCYQVLGVLHQNYRPLIYRIKDYIAVPKPNGYRSLHTTVFALDGKISEIQIRTEQMHAEAERGLAAHSLYNVHKDTKAYERGKTAKISKKLAWVSELAGLSSEADFRSDLIENLKLDLFRNRIFVFSPKGDLYDLPEGATPVDFAFAIHSDVGLRVHQARVNGRIASLDRPLQNRDVVDVTSRKSGIPNRQWLGFVKTATARSRIKGWFRAAGRESNIERGRKQIEAQLGAWGMHKFEEVDQKVLQKVVAVLNYKDNYSLLAAVGEGTLGANAILQRLLPARPISAEVVIEPTATGKAYVVGAPDLPCTLAKCCEPAPPTTIIGYITRGSGVTVHGLDCPNIPAEPDRLLDCRWQNELAVHQLVRVDLMLVCRNRIGLMRDITSIISASGVNILKITSRQDVKDNSTSLIDLRLELTDLFALSNLMQQLQQEPDVTRIKRRSSVRIQSPS